MELLPRFGEWLEEARERHPHYTAEEILDASLERGWDWLQRGVREFVKDFTCIWRGEL